MARKRKSRSTSGVGYSAIRRKAEPVNPFERKRNRYTPKCLMLPLLWRFFPDHPNLLPAWFEGEKSLAAPGESSVRKPIYSREGGNATIFDDRKNVIDYADSGYADEPMIYQVFQPLPRVGDSDTLIGSWIIDDEASGMGIREDNMLITKDTSRFVPHYIAD